MILVVRPVHSAIAGFLTVTLGCLIGVQMNGGWLLDEPAPATAVAPAAPHVSSPAAGVALAAGTLAAAPVAAANESYYVQLRKKIRWVETRLGAAVLKTPDESSRLLLAKSAAEHARLADVGLTFRDVYGIINAETSWIPRRGASKDGTPNLGIAQFEPATARALGLADPNDPVESVHVAALHMKEAALWSAQRLSGLKLSGPDRAEKLREGVSIYYNLSTRGRNAWNGRNTLQLPRETQRHIENARTGAQEAAWLDAQVQAAKYSSGRALAVAATSIQVNSR